MHAQVNCTLLTGRYCPSQLVRQDDGQAWHPDLPVSPDPDFPLDRIGALLLEQGYQLSAVYGDEDSDAFSEQALDSCDLFEKCLKVWQPKSPAGSGWLLVAILDALEGPLAWFVRPLVPSIQVARSADAPGWSQPSTTH